MTYQITNKSLSEPRFLLFTLNSLEWKFLIHFFTSRFWALASVWVIFLTNQGISLLEVALITTAYSLSIAVFEIPTGYIADRFGRKTSIIMAYMFQFAGIITFAFSMQTWQFMIGFAIWGIGMTMNSGAEQAWLYDEIKANPAYTGNHDNRYQSVYGLMVTVSFLSSTLAYGVGGFLAEFSLRIPIVLTGLVFFFSGIWLSRVPEHSWNNTKKVSTKDTTVKAFSILKHPEIMFLTIISMIVGGLITSVIYWIQPYFDNSDVSLTLIGIVGALGVLAASYGSSMSKKLADKMGTKTMIGIVAAMAIAFLLMSVLSVFLVLILFLVIRALRGAFNPYLSSMLNREFSSDIRATALSIVASVTTFSIMIAEIGSAFLIEYFSFSVFYMVAAILLSIIGIPAAVFYSRKH